MEYTGAYALVLALHLLTVVFLVGPAALAAVTSGRHLREGRADALRVAARTTRTCTQGTLLAVLLGTGLVGLGAVGDQWEFGQVWVSASYVLWLAAVVLQLVVVVPAQEQAAALVEAGGDAGRLAGRLGTAAGLAMLCWAAIVVLMVVKPGA